MSVVHNVYKGVKYIALANLTSEEIRLSKNRKVAEFHPRDTDVYDVVRFGKGSGRRRRILLKERHKDK